MIEFDEIAIRNNFISDIREIFNKNYDIIGTEVEVLSSNNQLPTFPCCVVSLLNPISNKRYDDNRGSFRMINLSLNCELYSKELDRFDLEDSVILLSQILVKGLIEKYGTLILERNTNAPFRTDVKRRILTFDCIYDVENNIIYSR